MDMLKRNPRHPKHEEFHDGEHEYWPVRAPLSPRRIRFPAIGLVAAAAAAAVVTMAMLALYTQSAPRMISGNQAIVNVNIYNNTNDLDIRYLLTAKSDPDSVLQQGDLEQEEETLDLRNLQPGTRYVLEYESLQENGWVSIGDFEFITPGNPADGSVPAQTPTADAELETGSPDESQPQTEETTPETEPTLPEETVPEEGSDAPAPPAIWYPPAQNPGNDTDPETPEAPGEEDPKPPAEPEPEEPVEPEDPADPEEPLPEVTPAEPDLDEVSFIPPGCGVIEAGYYTYQQIHSFQNVPEGGGTVTVMQNGEAVEDFSVSQDGSGNLTVTFPSGPVPVGERTASVVTVTLEDGSTVQSTQEVVPPTIEDTILTAANNGDGTFTFTLTVTTNPDSDFGMEFVVSFYQALGNNSSVMMEMTQAGDHTYTGTVTAAVEPSDTPQTAYVFLSAVWDMAGTPLTAGNAEEGYANVEYTP